MEQDNIDLPLQGSTSEADELVIVIAGIRVTDITASPRRTPAGFYASILIGDEEYRTMNKRVSLDSGTIEWTDHFRLPADTSTTIDLRIHASFELGPMLGRGELLRRVCISVEDLIEPSDTARPIAFLCEQGSSSLEVNLCLLFPADLESVVLPPPVAVGSPVEHDLHRDTDIGHSYMLRYYRDRQGSLLEDAISRYKSVVDRCPEDHACRGAALSNLAMAQLLSCEDRGSWHDLNVPIALYRDALNLHSDGHPDHGFALINLANALFFRFHKTGSNVDADEAEELLATVLEICQPDRDEHRSALLMVQRLTMRDTDDVVSSDFTTPGSSARSGNLLAPYAFASLADMLKECTQREDPQLLNNVILGHRQAEAYYVAGQPDWIALQLNLAIALKMRFGRKGRKQDLDEAIKRNEDVLPWTFAGHPSRADLLNNLANALRKRFEQRGDSSDLDKAVQHHRDALSLRPVGDSGRLTFLNNLANALTTRFEQRGGSSDLDDAVQYYRDALSLRPIDHPLRSRSLNILANALTTRFEQRGDCSDLDEAVQYYRDALRPIGHPDYSNSLNNLANALTTRFEQRGASSDLDEAIQHHRDALLLTPIGHPHRSSYLNNLGNALRMRFEQQGESTDLDEAVQHHRDALVLRPISHPGRSAYLNNLATTLTTRFEERGDSSDLDEAVRYFCDALSLRPIDHPGRSTSLNNLASAFAIRFGQRGDSSDLNEAVQHYRDALLLRPIGHPLRSGSLSNLAGVLTTRFEQQGVGNDLDEAIQLHHDALSLTPIGHPGRSTILSNLASALRTRFEQRGGSSDLDEAVQCFCDALSLTPNSHPGRSASLNNLANALRVRFEQQGDNSDLDDAVQHHRDALSLRPIGHPLRFGLLDSLATTLRTRFEQQGVGNDLDEAIQHHRDALLFTPIGHPSHSITLSNLANALMTRCEQQGDSGDLDEAVQHFCAALSLTPPGHPGRSATLDNLATALATRFEQRGCSNDLDEAIQHHRDALSLRPIGHAGRSTSLNNLANALRTRFEQRGDSDDLDEAVQHHDDALSLKPIGQPDRSASLSNLASVLTIRFDHRGDHNDLDKAVQYHRDALSLTPIGHPRRSGSFNNLANVLVIRFEQQGDTSDLDEAIQLHRDALSLTDVGHPGRSRSFYNLGDALRTRFEHQASGGDVDEALQLCHAADTETPSGHPIRLSISRLSASIHLALWRGTRVETHLHSAMASYKVAADVETSGLLPRLQSCLAWVQDGEEHGHESTLEAYTRAIILLDTHISATASVSVRHVTMKDFPASLAVDAASCALHHGDVPRALELLEQGRALLWNQMTRFRTSLDDLRSRDAHAEILVERFQELSFQLGKQSTDEPSSRGISRATVDEEARHYRQLVEQWHKAVAEIRAVDGFSRFLLPPLFSDLQEAACEGPVIILVASQFSCDAIIVLHDRPPIHIALDITLQQLAGLAYPLRQEIFDTPTPGQSSIQNVLRHLWDTVMSPVMSKLEEFLEHGSRIWWCPTSIFTAFPLHAVGVSGRESVVGMYISSYTPSLSALIKARKDRQVSLPAHFAAIGQALPDGQRQPLLSVDQELEEIEGLLPPTSTVFTKLTGSASTRDEAHCALRDNPWVHFSCHGTQNLKEPFKSCLSMRDGPLSLVDIINTDLSKHEFAFLSACETAVGDLESMDEAIHLAAGLQFMGVKSVIGTLWKVMDDIALRMSSKFYKEFCSGDEMDPTRAARALHKAYMSLAREGVPLRERIMFIHIGI